jgi:hypothetical protein
MNLRLTNENVMCVFISELRQVGGVPVSSNNKTDRHNIAEILLKVTVNSTKYQNS